MSTEPIPYFYDSVGRSAIGVKPKQPLLDWINAIYPDSQLDETEDSTTYLLQAKNNNKETSNWLKRNFDKIFQNELNNWHTDDADWPANRTYKMFNEWFEVKIYAIVLDMEETPLVKD